MNLTFFSHTSDLSGAARSLYDLVSALLENEQVRCQVVLPKEGPLASLFMGMECEVIIADAETSRIWQWVSVWNAADFYQAYDGFASSVIPDVKKFAPDYIVSQTITSPWGVLCAEALGVSHVLSAREYGQLDHALNFCFGFNASVAAFYQNSDKILSISQGVSDVLFDGDSEQKCGVIYSGIELEFLYEPDSSSLSIADFFGQKSGPVVALIGTIQPGKGQLDLVQAVIREIRNGQNLRCLMVGMIADHEYQNILLSEIKGSGFADRFAIVDFVDDIYPLMRQVDLVVSCSRYEALGRTLIEAALLGKPIIYPNSGGPSEVFKAGLHGLSYMPGKPNELAKAIRDTFADIEKTQHRVLNAKLYCQKFFSRKSYAQRVMALLQSKSSQRVSKNSVSSLIGGGLKFSPGQISISSKLYIGGVSGYSEDAVVYLPVINWGEFVFDHRFSEFLPDHLRFDPLENLLCKLNDFHVSAYDENGASIEESKVTIKHNGKVDGSSILFLNFDPQLELIFDKPVSRVIFQGEIRKISSAEIARILSVGSDGAWGLLKRIQTISVVSHEKEMAALRAQKQNLIRALHKQQEREATLESIAMDWESQAKVLSHDVTEQNNKISRLTQLLVERGSQLQGLCHEMSLQEDMIASLQTFRFKASMLSVEIEQLRKDASENDGRLDRMAQNLSHRDARIVELGRELADSQARARDLLEDMQRLSAELGTFKTKLSAKDEQLHALLEEIAAKESRIYQIENEIAARDVQIAELRETNATILLLSNRDASGRKRLNFSNLESVNLHLLFLINQNGVMWGVRRICSAIRREGPKYFVRRLDGLINLLRINHQSYFDLLKYHASFLALLIAIGIRKLASNLYKLVSQKTNRYLRSDIADSVKTPTGSHKLIPNSDFVPLLEAVPISTRPVRAICFYLPQFHAIPENDAWWGEGFTEWSNVQPAKPQFQGHYQPHVPIDMGHYNLLDNNVIRRQIELAKHYGIEGFCFYFYWFGGKRLLEKPVENFLNDKQLDLPFCLCWANENWSRRWDGLDSEILIAQEHSPDDDYAFIQHVAQYMRDPRYIRIDGRPLLLVYRPSLLPSALETASRWRQWCLTNDIGEIYLAYTQSFEKTDPKEYGFDAAIEFPPNNSAPPDITDDITPYADGFEGKVYDWRVFIARSERYAASEYKLFRSVCPSWDNTARRKKTGTIFYNSSPALYERWLKNAIDDTVAHQANPEERLIFINAWNEWAEGAHLEPDAKYGYAWLQATRNALARESFTPDNVRRIILVAHDAYPHGAQMLVANMAKVLNQSLGFKVDLVCLGDGPLKSEYAKWATLHDLTGNDPHGEKAISLAHALYAQGHRHALVNTTVSGYFLKTLSDARISCVALIHELRGILEEYQLHGQAESIATHASKIVFAAQEVANAFNDFSKTSADKVVVRPQGVYKRCDKSRNINAVRTHLRQMLKLSDDAVIVLGAGYADHRKGIDLFVKAGLLMAARVPQARWVWIGHWERNMQNEVDKLLAAHPDRRDVFIFPGLQAETDMFYRGADIFALTSREDPFPSVVLEALDAEIPVVGFEGAGGFNTLLKEGCGAVVAKEDAQAFADTVAGLLEQPEARLEIGKRGQALINQRFSFRHYLYDLLDYLGIGLARVSVVVPNYNYANFLPERLESIIGQDYPIYEIIFLDDCSRDESLQVAERLLSQSGIDYQIIVNKKNSGSVFRQWRKGVELARGTHLWIAEADDSCEAGLISELVKGFRTPGVVLSYCESKQMDENNTLLAENYRYYVDDVDTKHWLTAYVMDGEHEIAEYLSVKNTIPNVSGVLFSKDALQSVLKKHFDEITAYRVAGDWMVYVLVLAKGKVSFSPASMNKHRRHSGGVTISGINRSQLKKIQKMQQYIAAHYPVKDEVIANASRYIDALCQEHNLELRG